MTQEECADRDNASQPADPKTTASSTVNQSEAPLRKGTEIKLANLEMGENVALLRLVALALVVQCGKCKKKTDMALGPGKTVAKTCEKCRTTATVGLLK